MSYYVAGDGFEKIKSKQKKKKFSTKQLMNCFYQNDYSYVSQLLCRVFQIKPNCVLKPNKLWPTGTLITESFI